MIQVEHIRIKLDDYKNSPIFLTEIADRLNEIGEDNILDISSSRMRDVVYFTVVYKIN